MQSFFESAWFTIIYSLLLLLSIAGGYILARNQYLKKQKAWKPSGTENAIIGFYSLLLSFALLSSGNANKERTNLIHQHADALSAIYRESTLSPDSVTRVIRERLVAILTAKLESVNQKAKDEDIVSDTKTDSLYGRLHSDIKQMATLKVITPDEHRFYIDKLNAAIALDYHIQYSELERTPITIMILLIGGSFLIGVLIGFTNGFNEEHHFLIPFIFFVLTSLTVISIRDLDNPTVGWIRPSYKNYENMLMDIRN